MTDRPTIKLSRLREIGWSVWDPICLRQIADDDWKDDGPCADEYDTYLLQVVGHLRHGKTFEVAVRYLEDIEMVHMGGGRVATTRGRAEATVSAIAAYLAGLPAGPLEVR